MTIREQLLSVLTRADDWCSGEELAKHCNVTRAAVWKTVQTLQKENVPIESALHRGYRIRPEADWFSAEGVERELGADAADFAVQVLPEVSSTNTLLRELAAAGAPEYTVLAAASQTGGRGRMGRSFYSPKDSGVYLSVLLRPKLNAEQAVSVTTMAAAAVCEALEELGAENPGIKWVNDVYADGKKVCGILTEAAFDAETGGMEYAVCGVGINVCPPEGGFPEELRDIAGCAFQSRRPGLRNRLTAAFLRHFRNHYEALCRGEDTYTESYRRRQIVPGKQIRVIRNPTDPETRTERDALALEVDERCRLRVRYEDGTEEALSTGEISVRRKD